MKEAYLAHSAEVALAVSLPSSAGTVRPSDSFDSIEEFFSDQNFEYVDIEDSPEAEGYSDHLQYDVRGVPRILEALNMIMWPSMVRTSTGGLRRTVTETAGLDEPHSHVFEHSFAAVSDTAPPDHSSLFEIDPRPTSDSLAELNAWLDNDGLWTPANRGQQGTAVPESSEATTTGTGTGDGFDDDFTEFLSVPPEVNMNAGFPSSAEVQDTTERIFGQGNDAPEGFDLTSILGALEAMRLEIGAITDVEERRKAAARVALSLAAGFGIDAQDEGDKGNDAFDEALLRELHQLK
ncbi:unnamed protein product [Rhizoctonia solani]|uniref:Uncharacterized protein n=1 Tax=Rhizoctonia solani TaxID=456999 RepID=A0A8H2X116_9AGAM|nr:unnamed protein product [Rhizoctonia solani]